MKNLTNVLASGANTPIFVLLIIIAIFGVIAIVAYVIYRFTHAKLKKEEKPVDEKQMASEELNRVLEPVKDDKLREEIEKYQESDDVEK